MILKLPEGSSSEETFSRDKDTVRSLIHNLGFDKLRDYFDGGEITHHRHSIDQPRFLAKHGRPLKIEFSTSDKRNLFLSLYRKTKRLLPSGCYARADLAPAELLAERECHRLTMDPSLPATRVIDAHLDPLPVPSYQHYSRDSLRSVSTRNHSLLPSSSPKNSEAPSISNCPSSLTTVLPAETPRQSIVSQRHVMKSIPRKMMVVTRSRRIKVQNQRFSP